MKIYRNSVAKNFLKVITITVERFFPFFTFRLGHFLLYFKIKTTEIYVKILNYIADVNVCPV